MDLLDLDYAGMVRIRMINMVISKGLKEKVSQFV